MQWGSSLMQHMSRWAEDLIIYSTGGFAVVRLSNAYSTGSLLMPQNKNPDSLEVLRGQKSVEPLLDHCKTVGDSFQIANGVIANLATNLEKMMAALEEFMLATDIAGYLVRKGVPFRTTHHISGECVALAEKLKAPMEKLTYEQLRGTDSRFEEDVNLVFNHAKSVEQMSAKGGPVCGGADCCAQKYSGVLIQKRTKYGWEHQRYTQVMASRYHSRRIESWAIFFLLLHSSFLGSQIWWN
ncbi:MAG: hypothetical protein M1818_006718 [Claussenomyces sp. TS43310]|nr:MAG: hypothetical protein M1818_006718 [Claussenomyces sp. TS43310]